MPRIIKYTKELLAPLIQESTSVADVARRLGIAMSGGSHTHLSHVIKRLDLDTSHFTGRSWNKGRRAPKKTPDEILVNGYECRAQPQMLRRALIQIGRLVRCVECGIGPEYNGKPLILEVDHINNDWTDNRRENLQFMCPNCHGQKTVSDGAKAKFLKQLKTPIIIRPLPIITAIQSKREDDGGGRQLKLPLSNWKAKHPRRSPPGTNWRALPKPDQRKVLWPSKEELTKLVWERPILQVGKQYGVTEGAVRKWCHRYGIEYPPVRYWPRRQAGWTHEEALEPVISSQPKKVLSDTQVSEILVLLAQDNLSQRKIAVQYQTTHATISRIKSGQAYRHVPRM